MSLTDRLDRFFDLFSRRQKVHGPGYNPPTISRELHGRVVLLYSEVISGRLNTRGWGYAEDHSASFFAQMHQALRLLYGRANLAHQRQRSEAEDVMAFTNECTAEQLFDFIEASFKLDVSSRIFGEENEFVFELPNALYHQYNKHQGNGQSALLQAVRASMQRTYPSSDIGGDGAGRRRPELPARYGCRAAVDDS